MIDLKNFFDQPVKPVKNDGRRHDNLRNITTRQRDDFTIGGLLHNVYLKSYYKMIAIDLSKQQPLDADPKAMQQINFTGNLDRAGNTMFFIIDKAKETILDFSQEL